MRNLLLLSAVALLMLGCKPKEQTTEGPAINWLSIEEVQLKMKTEPRKVLIDVYAVWCGPCKMMAKNTFTDSQVVDYINKNYYAVKFDAESKPDVLFLGKNFKNRKRTHDFAIEIGSTNRGLSYPTIVYFDENFKKLQAVPGYYNANQYLPMIKFFGDNHYKTKNYDEYMNDK